MLDNPALVRLLALPLLASLVAGLAAGLATAQSSSGSETRIALSQSALVGGGTSTSVSLTVEAGIGQPAVGARATSESFAVTSGVVATEPIVGTSEPLVFGTRAASGTKEGDDVVTIYGLNFTEPGAGAAAVQFDGVHAFPVAVVSNTRISARTPAGLDALGNPKAMAPVRVTNALGAANAGQGFLYTPALVQETPAQIGRVFRFHLWAEPLTFHVVAFGGAIPILPFSLNPFDGKLALATNPVLLTQLALTTSGYARYEFLLPDQPSLVGKSLQLQALAITDVIPPLAGSFTNVLTVPFHP